MDMYSDCIREIYRKYSENKIIDTVYDSDLLLDYVSVIQARMTYLTDDARYKANELADLIQSEILHRMELCRQQARSFSDNVYDMITNGIAGKEIVL